MSTTASRRIKLESLKLDTKLKLRFKNQKTHPKSEDTSLLKSLLLENCGQLLTLQDWIELAPHPDTKSLAHFASLVYRDDAHCGDREDDQIPEGWALLATARKRWKIPNGYNGMAFVNPALQQVVIAHRGTKLTNLGAVNADVQGIVRNKYVNQMTSAMTFSYHIYRLLQEINSENEEPTRKCFQLSFTGHSLGGWLAQVSTFTVKYLTVDEGYFVVNNDSSHGYHPHTVVFDSPGCLRMLTKLKMDLDKHYDSCIKVDHLDITTYLSAPNMINTQKMHVGTIYRILQDYSGMSCVDRTIKYTTAVHKMDKILKVLKKSDPDIEILDWPKSGDEYKELFSEIKHKNDYHSHDTEAKARCKVIRYDWKAKDVNCGTVHVLSDEEVKLIQEWKKLSLVSTKLQLLETFADKHNVQSILQKYAEMVQKCEIESKTEKITSENLPELIAYTKHLLRWFPKDLLTTVKKQLNQLPRQKYKLFRSESEDYIEALRAKITSEIKFNDKFQVKSSIQGKGGIYEIVTENTELEALRTYQAVDNQTKPPIILSWEKLVAFSKLEGVNFASEEFDVVIIESSSGEISDSKLVQDIFACCSRLILITTRQVDINDKIPITQEKEEFRFRDLTIESQITLLQKRALDFNGQILSLQDFLGVDINTEWLNQSICPELLERLLYSTSELIKLNNSDFGVNELNVVYCDLDQDISKENLPNFFLRDEWNKETNLTKDVIFVVQGLGCEAGREINELMKRFLIKNENYSKIEEKVRAGRIVIDNEGRFKPLCRDNPADKIYLLVVTPDRVVCIRVYDSDFRFRRKVTYAPEIVIDQRIANTLSHKKEHVLVFSTARSQEKFLTVTAKTEDPQSIVTVTREEALTAFEKETENQEKSVHLIEYQEETDELIWRRFRGPLETLGQFANEGSDTIHKNWKTMLIVDEPAMGKSTALATLSLQMTSSWVVLINLKDYQEAIDGLPSTPTLDDVVEFLMCKSAKLPDRKILAVLLRENLRIQTRRRVQVMLDGFDEIRETEGEKGQPDGNSKQPTRQEKILGLLKFLSNDTGAIIWVTSRKHLQGVLEDNLSVSSVRFEALAKKRQKEFLNLMWSSRLIFEVNEFHENEKARLRQYVKTVLKKAREVLRKDIIHFMGVPLQMLMIAAIGKPKPEIFSETSSDLEGPFTNVVDLYQKFVDMKFAVYFKKTGLSTKLKPWQSEVLKKESIDTAKKLGFGEFFPLFDFNHQDKRYEFFPGFDSDQLDELYEVGISQKNRHGKFEFIHLTVAEYFAAEFLCDWFKKKTDVSLEERFFDEILNAPRYAVIRLFFNILILQVPDHVMKHHAQRLSQLPTLRTSFGGEQRKALQLAAKENNNRLVQLLLESMRRRDGDRYINWRGWRMGTALHDADQIDRQNMYLRFLENGVELNFDTAPLHFAAAKGHKDVCPVLLKNEADIRAMDNDGATALQLAADNGHEEVCAMLNEAEIDDNTC